MSYAVILSALVFSRDTLSRDVPCPTFLFRLPTEVSDESVLLTGSPIEGDSSTALL